MSRSKTYARKPKLRKPDPPDVLWPRDSRCEVLEGYPWPGGCKIEKPRRTFAEWLCHQAFKRICRQPSGSQDLAYTPKPTAGGEGPYMRPKMCALVVEEKKAKRAAWKRAAELWFNLIFRRGRNRRV